MTWLKYINIRTPNNFAETLYNLEILPWVITLKDADGIANSEDPDQTASKGAVGSGSALEGSNIIFHSLTFARSQGKC